jgi:glutamate N-acetyltransferase/amino-acid N-acetyltransferase
MIVKDGEGATKTVRIIVKGAKSVSDAESVARTIGTSLLVKSALYGEDPNWGRIVAAAGRAGVDFDPDRIDLYIGDHKVLRNSKQVMDEAKALEIMKTPKFTITLDLKTGKKASFVITSDITYDYLKINAHYRT